MDSEELLQNIPEGSSLLTTQDLYAAGLTQRRITGLVDRGELIRVKNGYYTLPSRRVSEDETILRLFPEGILTMESALYIYGYLPKKPKAYSIAVSKNISKSRFNIKKPLVIPYYTEGETLVMGVDSIDFGGGTMKIYSKERLICEVLKFEDKMRREDVKSALLSYIGEKEHDLARLTEYSIKRQVKNKVRSRLGDWL